MDTTNNPTHPERPTTPRPAPGLANPDWPLRRSATAPALGSQPDPVPRALTEREKQILRLVCDGLSNAGIASRLGISPETVKSELKRIFRKIDVKNRTQAAVLLVRGGLL